MARITTLVAVILNILRVDDSMSINCQVRMVSLIYTQIDRRRSLALGHFRTRKCPLRSGKLINLSHHLHFLSPCRYSPTWRWPVHRY
jgi:hypothetical protein